MAGPKYAPAVKGVLDALRKAIEDQALSNGVIVQRVEVYAKRGDTATERGVFGRNGIFVHAPDTTGSKPMAPEKRAATLQVPVLVVLNEYDSKNATYDLADLEGVVIDAVNADNTLAGTCRLAWCDSSETDALDGDELTLHTSTVIVRVELMHDLR